MNRDFDRYGGRTCAELSNAASSVDLVLWFRRTDRRNLQKDYGHDPKNTDIVRCIRAG